MDIIATHSVPLPQKVLLSQVKRAFERYSSTPHERKTSNLSTLAPFHHHPAVPRIPSASAMTKSLGAVEQVTRTMANALLTQDQCGNTGYMLRRTTATTGYPSTATAANHVRRISKLAMPLKRIVMSFC